MNKKQFYNICLGVVIFGAIDLGIFGLTDYDIIDVIFVDNFIIIGQIIDLLIGIAGVYLLYVHMSKKS